MSKAELLPDNAERFDKKKMQLNTPESQILGQVRMNILRPLPQLNHYPQQPDTEIAIVGGGWSLADTVEELHELNAKRVPILAVNGAGNYCVKNHIQPQILMVLDAREENLAFVEDPIPGCKYFLASQCHPSLFEACEDRDTYIYHVLTFREVEYSILYAHYGESFRCVPGGSTVGLRAISVAHMLGWRLMHLFGFDSCYAPDGRHHAYEQKWNDGEGVADMWAELKTAAGTDAVQKFRCSSWQAYQVEQFFSFMKRNGDQFQLNLHGQGLLATMMQTGAQIHLEKVKET